MNSKRSIVMLLALMLLVGCAQKEATPEIEPTETTEREMAATPTPRRTGVTLLADGVVQPADAIQPVAFEVSGKLSSLNVRLGDQVVANDVIATLDNTHIQDEIAQAAFGLELAELTLADLKKDAEPADVAAARASLASARANLTALTTPPSETQVRAAEQNLVSAKSALQTLLASYDPNGTGIAIERQQVEQAKNALWSTQLQRDATCGWVGKGGSQTQCDSANASVNQAEASVRIAELGLEEKLKGVPAGQLASAHATIAQAESALADLRRGPDPDAVAAAKAQVEQAEAALDRLLAGATPKAIETAEIQVEQARLTLDIAKRNLTKVRLVAPIAGTIATVEATEGALVGGGAPIVTILDADRLEFHTLNLSERDVVLIRPGQTAEVTLKAYPEARLAATVARIGLQIGDPVGDAATFPVVLSLAKGDLQVRPGMTGRVELYVEE